MEPRNCNACGTEFTPKKGGYNARYCKRGCKSSVKYYRSKGKMTCDERSILRRRSYEKTKSNADSMMRHLESNRKSVRKVREWLAKYKTDRGCADCGYDKYACALQLDHEGEKKVPISHARSSINRLLAEITNGKCVVRCANCHSIKTWERKGIAKNQK